MAKRLVPIGRKRNPNFRYIEIRSNANLSSPTTKWASCEEGITTVKFLNTKRNVGGKPSLFFTANEVGWTIAIGAAFAFAPLSIAGLTLGYAPIAVGNVVPIISSGLPGFAGAAFASFASALGFASQAVQTPTMTNFNKPCSEIERGF